MLLFALTIDLLSDNIKLIVNSAVELTFLIFFLNSFNEIIFIEFFEQKSKSILFNPVVGVIINFRFLNLFKKSWFKLIDNLTINTLISL